MALARFEQIKWTNTPVYWFNCLLALIKKNPWVIITTLWVLNFLQDYLASSKMDEGVYGLEPVHTEAEGWRIRVGDRGWILSRPPDHPPASGELCPVTAYRADGSPLFTRLAFLKLLDGLGPVWERGEVIELEVVSRGVPYRLESCRIRFCS